MLVSAVGSHLRHASQGIVLVAVVFDSYSLANDLKSCLIRHLRPTCDHPADYHNFEKARNRGI